MDAPAWCVVVAVLIVIIFNLLCVLTNERAWTRGSPDAKVAADPADNGASAALSAGVPARRLRGALVVVRRAPGVNPLGRPSTFMAYELISPEDLFHNGFVPAAPLALYRLAGLGIWIWVITYIAPLSPGGSFFKFFTNWTYVLYGLVQAWGSALTLQGWWAQRRQGLPATSADVGAGRRWGWQHRVWLVLFETVTSASITLTVFFWAAVYNPKEVLQVSSPFQHGVSAGMLLLDVLLSRVPLVSYHVWVPMLYGSVYEVFLWIFAAASNTWVYTALDWSKPTNLPYYIALPVLIIVSYTVMMLVGGLRELLHTGKCCVQCACCKRCCACCAPEEGADERAGGGEGQKVAAWPAAPGPLAAPLEVQMSQQPL